MVITEKSNIVKSSGIERSVHMGIDAGGMAFIQTILRTGMYSDKIASLIREAISNNLDAHVEAKIPERPIEITLPTRFNPIFKTRDFAFGLTEDSMMGFYSMYGSSSKRTRNDLIGAWGVGRMSPLSYVDSFVVISRNGGMKKSYSIFVNSSNTTDIAKLSEEPCNEESGLEIQVSVKDEDIQQFKDKLFNFCKYLKVKPIIHGATFVYDNLNPIFMGKDWRICANGQSVVIMGQVSYPVPSGHFTDESINSLLSCGAEIEMEIGSVEVSASREGLQMTPKTKDALKDKLSHIVTEVSAELNKRFCSCATLFDAHKLYGSIMDYSSNLYALRGMVKKNLVFKGQNILSADIKFTQPTDGSWTIKKYEKSYRGQKINSCAYSQIQCLDKTVLIKNDLNISNGITNRIFNLASADKNVYILSFKDNASFKAALKETGLEESNFILLSSLPKISLSSGNSYVKNSKHQSKEFSLDTTFKPNSYRHRAKSDYWTAETVNLASDSGVYVMLQTFEYKDKNGSYYCPSNLQGIIKKLETLGITIPKILGFKASAFHEVSKNKNMVCFWDYIKIELTKFFAAKNISQKLADKIEYDAHCNDYNWLKFMLTNGDEASKRSLFFKTAKIVKYLQHTESQKLLASAIEWREYYTPAKPKFSMKELCKAIETKYPLLKAIDFGWRFNFKSELLEYICLKD